MIVETYCDRCGMKYDWAGVTVGDRVYCCAGCASGGPCTCAARAAGATVVTDGAVVTGGGATMVAGGSTVVASGVTTVVTNDNVVVVE